MSLTSPKKILPFVIVLMSLIAEMSTDLYIPCLPEMASYFNVEPHHVVMTISSYLFGIAISGALSGPFSDSFGRRPVFLAGSLIFTLASIGCFLSGSVFLLILIRFCQGVGAGMAYVVSVAIVKDLYSNKMSSKIFSFMGMMVTMSPLIAPIFGGIIAAWWGWKMNFLLILFGAFVGLLIHFAYIPESLQAEQRLSSLSFKEMFSNYYKLLCQPRVIGFSLISGFACGGIWAWIASAPFYFINTLGIEPKEYGYYTAVGPAAYILGAIINQFCVGRFGVLTMLRFGLVGMVLGAFFLFLVVHFYEANLIGIYVSFVVYGVGMAPLFANSTSKAVDVTPQYRGTASSILSAIEMIFASISCFMVGFLSNNNLKPATLIILFCCLACVYLFYYVIGTKKYESQPTN